MNIAWFMYYGNYSEDGMFDVCIRSLKQQSDCKIVVYTPKFNRGGVVDKSLLESRGVEIVEFPNEDLDDRRMCCKIEKIYELMTNSNTGDNIMCLDADLFFLKDPFDVFKEDEFDYFYTTRDYSYFAKVNSGVSGFTVNSASEKFMQFYMDEINSPSWDKYIHFRKNHPYEPGVDYNGDWWVDQDFLCVCHSHKDEINNGMLEFDIKIIDATSKYNYIVTYLSNEEIDNEVKDKNKYILHFKANSHGRWEGGGDAKLRAQDKKMLDILEQADNG
jgi:hypothetical protein